MRSPSPLHGGSGGCIERHLRRRGLLGIDEDGADPDVPGDPESLIPLLPLLGLPFNLTIGVRVLGRERAGHAHDDHGGHGAHHAPSPLIGLVAAGTVFLSFLVAVWAVVAAHGAPDHAIVETHRRVGLHGRGIVTSFSEARASRPAASSGGDRPRIVNEPDGALPSIPSLGIHVDFSRPKSAKPKASEAPKEEAVPAAAPRRRGLAVGLRTGSEGYGVDAIFALSRRLGVRGTVGLPTAITLDEEATATPYDLEVPLGASGVRLDVHPWAGRLRLSGGVAFPRGPYALRSARPMSARVDRACGPRRCWSTSRRGR